MIKVISFSLPEQILNMINELCTKYGLGKSDIIRRAIQEYYEKNINK